jgi:hypothetical protein
MRDPAKAAADKVAKAEMQRLAAAYRGPVTGVPARCGASPMRNG